eukprot:SAG11_NODE_21_length_25065_cov_3.589081_1_plen_81_part_00
MQAHLRAEDLVLLTSLILSALAPSLSWYLGMLVNGCRRMTVNLIESICTSMQDYTTQEVAAAYASDGKSLIEVRQMASWD